MKKNQIIIIVSVILAGAAAFLVYKNQSSTVRKAERDFAVKDTAAVTKIFLADRSGKKVLLERQADGSWSVNKKYPARQEGIRFLFDCFSRIRVQSRVSKNAYNTVLKELSTTGIKCEIYLNHKDEPEKVYYVGGATQDNLGTFMMLETSSVPFITEVPGFNGYLTPRYSAIENDWRSSRIIGLQPEEIKMVKIEYYDHPEKSFVLERTSASAAPFRVYSPVSNEEIAHPDTIKINIYLSYFHNLSFEGWDYTLKPPQIDSLKNTQPVVVMTVEDRNGEKTVLPMYLKSASVLSQLDSTKKDLKYDMERMNAFVNNGQDVVTIQYFVFNKVLATLKDFEATEARKK